MRQFVNIMMTVAAVTLSLCSCSREGTSFLRGDYSFKTSGTISVTRDPSCRLDTSFVTVTVPVEGQVLPEIRIDTVVTVHDDTLRLVIDNESGQMNIAEIDRKTGEMLVTMNISGGGVLAFRAVAEGNSLEISPFQRFMTLVSGSQSILGASASQLAPGESGSLASSAGSGIQAAPGGTGSDGLSRASGGSSNGSELDGARIRTDVEVGGVGKRYEDILLLNLRYRGEFTSEKILYQIVDSDVLCRARRNE
ncbi:MAG: hypothetical protein PUB45_06780 [Bacteroidales bacterium]|nr:hypothetical protein [Bacteroidales bacterium]